MTKEEAATKAEDFKKKVYWDEYQQSWCIADEDLDVLYSLLNYIIHQ